MSEAKIDAEFFPIFEGATALVAAQFVQFRDENPKEPTENEKLMAGHIVGNLCANGYMQLPGTVERMRAAIDKVTAWLDMLATQSDRQVKVNRGRFDSLADACAADAKNYRATAADLRKAINQQKLVETK